MLNVSTNIKIITKLNIIIESRKYKNEASKPFIISDCPLEVATSNITGDGTCLITSNCTAVDCCVDVDFLGRAFNAYLELDPCAETIKVGVDRLSFILPLADHGFGKYCYLH